MTYSLYLAQVNTSSVCITSYYPTGHTYSVVKMQVFTELRLIFSTFFLNKVLNVLFSSLVTDNFLLGDKKAVENVVQNKHTHLCTNQMCNTLCFTTFYM